MLKAKGEDTSAIEAEVRAINEQITALDVKAEDAAAEQTDLLLNIPNLPHDACPVGSRRNRQPGRPRVGRQARTSPSRRTTSSSPLQLGLINWTTASASPAPASSSIAARAPGSNAR